MPEPRYEPVPDDVLPEAHLAALEAVLMVVDEPVPAAALAAALGLPTGQVVEPPHRPGGGVPRRRAGPGPRLRACARSPAGGGSTPPPAHADVVGRFVLEGQTARLTQASLETLAVIAYRQPVTRGRVAAIRGVNVDGVVRTLLARGLVEEAGPDPDGGAMRYRTTSYFLERMGLGSLADLPRSRPTCPSLASLDEMDADL